MKTLRDSLERLFGTPPESTPAVPAPLREAAAAEAACYDYPVVSALDDLPPDSALPPPAGKDSCDCPDSAAFFARESGCIAGSTPVASCTMASPDGLFPGLAACDPRAFSKRLQQGVREVHGGNPVAFYTAAGISRSAYSRLVSHPERHPSKDTVLSMAAALRMALPEAEKFLRLVGYALSPHIPADLVWQHCFQTGLHDLPAIRRMLARVSGTPR